MADPRLDMLCAAHMCVELTACGSRHNTGHSLTAPAPRDAHCNSIGLRSMKTKDDPEKIGRYTVLERIGKGAMGVVYKASDPNLRRTVAIKMIHDHLVEEEDSGEFLKRFATEGMAASQCSHPNIASVYDYFVEFNSPRLVMEYVDAAPLSWVIQQQIQKRPTLEEVAALGIALGNALGHAHEKGIVHRDIKPSNILVAEGVIKIVDFGVARIVDTEKTQSASIGTPRYMSPEQTGLGPDLEVDGRADIYSTAVVLYEFATGRHPFHANTQHELFREMMHGVVPRAQNVPSALADVLQKAMAPDRARRFPDAAAFTTALQRAIVGEKPAVVSQAPAEADTTLVFSDDPDAEYEPLVKLLSTDEKDELTLLFKKATEGRFRSFLLTAVLQEAHNVEELVMGILNHSPAKTHSAVREMIEDFARRCGLTARIGHARRAKISATEVARAASRLRARYGKRAMTIAANLKNQSRTVSDFRSRVDAAISS